MATDEEWERKAEEMIDELNRPILNSADAAKAWMDGTSPQEWRDLLSSWANEPELSEEMRGKIRDMARRNKMNLPFEKLGAPDIVFHDQRAQFEAEFIARVSAAVDGLAK